MGVGFNVPSCRIWLAADGNTLTEEPKSQRAVKVFLPTTQGMLKLPGSCSFLGMWFKITALQSSVKATNSGLSKLLFLVIRSLKKFAYRGTSYVARAFARLDFFYIFLIKIMDH
jgi:hypothetical protein